MTRHDGLTAALRAHAHGVLCLEAACELLIAHRFWLQRNDLHAVLAQTVTAPNGATDIASMDWPAAITALDSRQLPCSGGEARILRLAASLADGVPIDLRDALTGLDSSNIDLVCHAVLHISGHHTIPAT